MKITITRSFRQVKQLHAFEPIESICEVSAEIETTDYPLIPLHKIDEVQGTAEELDIFCRTQVLKTLAEIRAPKEQGKGKVERKEIAKEESMFDAGQIN